MRSIAIYGDSISTKNHGEGGYEDRIRKGLKLDKIYNFSVGSSGLTSATPDHMLEILEKNPIPEDVDLVLVWHGSNDWYWGSTLQDFTEGIKEAVERIHKGAPKAFLVWCTPIFRYETPHEGSVKGQAYLLKNRVGNTLYEYYRQLEMSSGQVGFYLLDMHRFVNINQENMELYLEDQVHPNKQGYEKIAKVMVHELERFFSEIQEEKR